MSVEREESAPLLPSTNVHPESEVSAQRSGTSESAPGPAGRLDMVPTTRDKVALTSIFVGLALVLGTSWYLVFSGDLKAMGWFAVHPPMQSLAITAFLLGITPLQPPGTNSSIKATRFKSHQNIMLGLALPILTIGSVAMVYNKYLHGAPHFTSWHGKLGLISICWILAQASIGAASVWFDGKLFGGKESAKRVYKYHRLSGYLLITLMLSTIYLAGIHSDWANGRKHTNLRIAAYYVGLPLIWIGLELRSR
ncbi:uncharacterized protein I303_105732 [Kwoniella dejecticola CBS 10117]|uniref:Cytochrome b561 domain-containing protein n=1 Tax=Kwoniella dejecticola CBS 10117 TaxID=1296121 RepID=A0A1A6A092_9TREE|nr:uncharacterized protein I303_05754 [Kwoniella dejecticola CBS 10117]OBR83475.1 hypothetical protein I303_05754 [Kwoniella dejecticola CBS 10117]